MKKTIEILGESYSVKKLNRLAIVNNTLTFITHNTLFLFEKYVALIKHSDGSYDEFYSNDENPDKGTDFLLYQGKPNKVIFNDEVYAKRWSDVFVYAFSDDKAYFLCSNREYTGLAGIWSILVDSYEMESLRNNILICADWFKKGLTNTILNIESSEDHNDLLTLGGV